MEKVILNEYPLVFYVDNFITEEGIGTVTSDCDHLIQLSSEFLVPAKVAGVESGVVSQGRTNRVHWLDKRTDATTKKITRSGPHKLICREVAALLGTTPELFENMQVIHYHVNEEYQYHYDAFDANTERAGKRCLEPRGQRITTTLLYLNNVERGGATSFQKLGISVAPKKGYVFRHLTSDHCFLSVAFALSYSAPSLTRQSRILVFENLQRDSNQRHADTLHAGLPVEAGEKWAANLWLRQHPKPCLPADGLAEAEMT